MARKERVRVGIIGAGGIANAHIVGYLAHPLSEVVAIANPNLDKAQAVKERHGLKEARLFADYRELIADASIDAVSICTPNHLHHDQAVAAIQAGKHVLCEKPLGMDAAEAAHMRTTASRAGVVHMVGFIFQFFPAIQYAKKLIVDGVIGRLRRMRCEYLKDMMGLVPRRLPPEDWRFSRAKAGSGPLGAMGSHALHLGRFLVGEITSLSASARKFTTIGDVEENIGVICQFSGGAAGIFEFSFIATGRSDFFRIEVSGDKGAFVFDYEKPSELEVCSKEGVMGDRGRFLSVPVPDCPQHQDLFAGHRFAFMKEVAHFLDCIRDGSKASPDFLDGLKCQALLDACLRSSVSGLRVDVPPVGEQVSAGKATSGEEP